MQTTEKIWRNGSFVRVGRRAGSRPHPRPPLRHRRIRGHPGLRDARRHGVFRLTRAPRATAPLGSAVRDGARATRPRSWRRRCTTRSAANGMDSCYIRPIVFRGYGEMGLFALSNPVDVAIAVWPWGAYLGEEALEQGVRCKVSSYRRYGPNTLPPAAKASGQYINSVLAKHEALALRLRRGDPAERAGLHRRRLGRERVRRARRRDPHAADAATRACPGSPATA